MIQTILRLESAHALTAAARLQIMVPKVCLMGSSADSHEEFHSPDEPKPTPPRSQMDVEGSPESRLTSLQLIRQRIENGWYLTREAAEISAQRMLEAEDI